MSSYLEIFVGPTSILIDAACVHEILKIDSAGGDAAQSQSDYRQWQGQELRRVSCRSMLGLQADQEEERIGIVYSSGHSDTPPVILEVDGIEKFNQITDKKYSTLPLVSKRIDAVLDKVPAGKASGLPFFHLRRPNSKLMSDNRVAYDVSLGFDGFA